ncbi:MAG: hypothetical protein WD772_09590 [Pseudohongiellaceae bacterium]
MPCLLIRRLLTPVLALGMVSPAVYAADNNSADLQGNVPSLEFLEFLGQWETDEGEWLPPEQLIEGEFVQLLDAALMNLPPQEPDPNSDNEDNQTND